MILLQKMKSSDSKPIKQSTFKGNHFFIAFKPNSMYSLINAKNDRGHKKSILNEPVSMKQGHAVKRDNGFSQRYREQELDSGSESNTHHENKQHQSLLDHEYEISGIDSQSKNFHCATKSETQNEKEKTTNPDFSHQKKKISKLTPRKITDFFQSKNSKSKISKDDSNLIEPTVSSHHSVCKSSGFLNENYPTNPNQVISPDEIDSAVGNDKTLKSKDILLKDLSACNDTMKENNNKFCLDFESQSISNEKESFNHIIPKNSMTINKPRSESQHSLSDNQLISEYHFEGIVDFYTEKATTYFLYKKLNCLWNQLEWISQYQLEKIESKSSDVITNEDVLSSFQKWKNENQIEFNAMFIKLLVNIYNKEFL